MQKNKSVLSRFWLAAVFVFATSTFVASPAQAFKFEYLPVMKTCIQKYDVPDDACMHTLMKHPAVSSCTGGGGTLVIRSGRGICWNGGSRTVQRPAANSYTSPRLRMIGTCLHGGKGLSFSKGKFTCVPIPRDVAAAIAVARPGGPAAKAGGVVRPGGCILRPGGPPCPTTSGKPKLH
jgi:hypothetical protein